jgi:putative endopeptidase
MRSSLLFKFASVISLTVCGLVAQTNASRVSGPPQFDLSAIDKSVDPCVDFYHYACGTWIKNNPIPADQAMWGRFHELADRNRDILHEILEQAAKPSAGRDATTQKIGDYFGACLDEKAIDAKGLAPVEPELARIRNLKDKSELAALIAHLHTLGVGVVFQFSSGQDFKDSNAVIAQFDQAAWDCPTAIITSRTIPSLSKSGKSMWPIWRVCWNSAARSPTSPKPMPMPS